MAILKTTGFIGHRFENWFLNELQTWLSTKADRHQINFWRTASQAEIDFVVTLGNQVIPFEVTLATNVDKKKDPQFKELHEKHSKIYFWGYLLSRSFFI